MTEPRLRSGIWIAATLRRYDAAGIPATIARKGDADGGALMVKMNQYERGCSVLTQARTGSGELVWMRVTGPVPVEEAVCDAYLLKAAQRDPDLWVIEIEDREGRVLFEGKVV